MCIIIGGLKRKLRRDEQLEGMRINHFGYAVSVIHRDKDGTKKVNTIRTLDRDEAMKAWDAAEAEDYVVTHSRIPSAGGHEPNMADVHGWCRNGVTFFHNGTLSNIIGMMPKTDHRTDSLYFFEEIFVPLWDSQGRKFTKLLTEVSEAICGSSRMCFILPDGTVRFIGDYEKDHDCMFSNRSYKVYGERSGGSFATGGSGTFGRLECCRPGPAETVSDYEEWWGWASGCDGLSHKTETSLGDRTHREEPVKETSAEPVKEKDRVILPLSSRPEETHKSPPPAGAETVTDIDDGYSDTPFTDMMDGKREVIRMMLERIAILNIRELVINESSGNDNDVFKYMDDAYGGDFDPPLDASDKFLMDDPFGTTDLMATTDLDHVIEDYAEELVGDLADHDGINDVQYKTEEEYSEAVRTRFEELHRINRAEARMFSMSFNWTATSLAAFARAYRMDDDGSGCVPVMHLRDIEDIWCLDYVDPDEKDYPNDVKNIARMYRYYVDMTVAKNAAAGKEEQVK